MEGGSRQSRGGKGERVERGSRQSRGGKGERVERGSRQSRGGRVRGWREAVDRVGGEG